MTRLSDGVACSYAACLAALLYVFGLLACRRLILTSAGVREVEAASTLPGVPCALYPGGCQPRGSSREVTLVSGNKQPSTQLCFIWEEHVGGFQELDKQPPCTLCRGGQSTVQS